MKFFSISIFQLATLLSAFWGDTVAVRLGQLDLMTGNGNSSSNNDRRLERRKNLNAILRKRLASDLEAIQPKRPFQAKQPDMHRDLATGYDNNAHNADGRTLIIECLEPPVFDCATCLENLQAQQASVLVEIQALYPQAQQISQTQRLMNAIYIQLPLLLHQDDSTVDAALRQIEGVKDVTPHGSLQMEAIGAVEYLGGYKARDKFCATGKDVRVAVLDGGIDYTHKLLGGNGTIEDFRDAYGALPQSSANRERDGLFPTDVVVDGYDFIGEFNSLPIADPDPIDSFGHGTAVADAIRTVAPGAKLVALKVCSTGMTCPVFSIINGLEFALDPNRDGQLDDKVDIINLSLGIPFVSPFYNFVASALEKTYALGVLPVVAAGNSGNIPYIMGGLSGSPNSISVGATGHPDSSDAGVMAEYSSRGPGESNMMKPDIVAPSGLTLAAAGTGYLRYRSIQGTSFSAPLVAGAAAVVMERCPDCSPFAIKALLMNNANRDIRYVSTSEELSPATLSGAGEMQIDKTLEADFWAYAVEDVQPSMSLGLINAIADVTIRKTIKVTNLSGRALTLDVSYQMRDPSSRYADALTVELETPVVELTGDCGSEASVEVVFKIDASKAPPNHMTSTGRAGFDARRLDVNELGGHIILSDATANKDISLPFVGIVRQASDVTIDDPVIRDVSSDKPTSLNLGLVNNGAGTAQIDAFELVGVSGDDVESSFGDAIAPNDIRYVGYRVLPVGIHGCSHLLEFAFNTWERKNGRLVTEIYGVELDVDGDGVGDLFLYNSGLATENFVVDLRVGRESCTGMPPDHSTSSATTVLRACSEALGIEDFVGNLGLRFEAISFSDQGEVVTTDSSTEIFTPVTFPKPRLSAPSYDINPGEGLGTLEVDGTLDDSPGFSQKAMGLMLVTNSFRTSNSTGASTPETEAVILLQEDFDFSRLPQEITMDGVQFPQAENLRGPACSWKNVDTNCEAIVLDNNNDANTDIDTTDTLESPIEEGDSILNPILPMAISIAQTTIDERQSIIRCEPVPVPRAKVQTPPPTENPMLAPSRAPQLGLSFPTTASISVTVAKTPIAAARDGAGSNAAQTEPESSTTATTGNGANEALVTSGAYQDWSRVAAFAGTAGSLLILTLKN